MKSKVVIYSAALPLALISCLNTGSVVGVCKDTVKAVAALNENTVQNKTDDAIGVNNKNTNKATAGLCSKNTVQNENDNSSSTISNIEEKSNGSASSLSAEDKDKIIKVLLEKMEGVSPKTEVQVTSGNTLRNKEKYKGVVANIFQKFGNIGSFVYAIYGAYGLAKGDVTVKDVATATTALLGISNLGSQAIKNF